MKSFPCWVTLIAVSLMCQPASASIPKDTISKWQSERSQEYTASFKSVFVNFWNKDLRNYHLHEVVHGLIRQIDNEEMRAFLKEKGVNPDTKDILTSGNLITYLRHKDLGTEAVYGWIDLWTGNPDFRTAVLDWQAMQKEYGFEFAPTYYLLFKAKLKTREDADAWSTIFKATFDTLSEGEQDKRALLLLCLMPRIWGDLKLAKPSALERFAFLVEESKKQKDTSTAYYQLLVFNLYGLNFSSNQYKEAAKFGMMLKPKTTSLLFTFLAQVLGHDVRSATATLTEMSALPFPDQHMISLCREMIDELEKMQKELNKSAGGDGKPAPQP